MFNLNQIIPISKNEIKSILKDIKKNKLNFSELSEEYKRDPIIVQYQRKLKKRYTDESGYDIITNNFFVKEFIQHKNIFGDDIESSLYSTFENFEDYFSFLDGDIYINSCYYQYIFTDELIKQFHIDMNKINMTSLIQHKITEFTINPSNEEYSMYKQSEKDKLLRKKWINKFSECSNYDDFIKILKQYKKSKFDETDLRFILFNYISIDKNKTHNIIMNYIANDTSISINFVLALCSIYNPDDIFDAYCNNSNSSAKSKSKLKSYIKELKNNKIQFNSRFYFDEITHYYCKETCGYINNIPYPISRIYQYYDTFDELSKYLNGDLTNCDFSKDIFLNQDFSKFNINKNTKLPIQCCNNIIYELKKRFDRHDEFFYVHQRWSDDNKNIFKEYTHKFKYFFDFVSFLNGDLSNADLLFCDGFHHLHDISELTLTNVKLRSSTLSRYNLPYSSYNITEENIQTFSSVIKAEQETSIILQSSRPEADLNDINMKDYKIYYISDLHLMHRIQNANCISYNDMIYTIQQIVDNLLENFCSYHSMLLIGGDISSNFDFFKLFVTILKDSIHDSVPVVFVLGNHELWQFPNSTIHQIIEQYKNYLSDNGMYLLQNNILFLNDFKEIEEINEYEINMFSPKEIRTKLARARVILFGGIGFSGNNDKFNATIGVYRNTITREVEIQESQKIDNLYKKVCDALNNRKVIVLTHTPYKDWSLNKQQSGFIYVSGHTHRNYFYDDGEYRIYSDNQVGYYHEKPHLKYFLLDSEYDTFIDYQDGIYQITREQYIDFYHGKNINMDFNRDIHIIHMLKKSDYYCFIHENKRGGLSILNGGALKKLDYKDVNYYFDHMDALIKDIEKPLYKFTTFQQSIAKLIKQIGGSGKIHGCIIDIDFYNHIFVNPFDLTITAYWASDIINKELYPDIPMLLEDNCPKLYSNYNKLLEENNNMLLVLKSQTDAITSKTTQSYLDTNIYAASREIKKMQRLHSKILSAWYDTNKTLLE